MRNLADMKAQLEQHSNAHKVQTMVLLLTAAWTAVAGVTGGSQ